MNNSLKILYDEHYIIAKALSTANRQKSLIGKDDAIYEKNIRTLIHFFRSYADQFHHHKEELILFPEMIRHNELLAYGVLKEMRDNHTDFREMILTIEKHLDAKNYLQAQQQLGHYADALLDHIAAENEEVFPMAESMMNNGELENMFFRFNDCDRNLGVEKKVALKELADELRKELI